MGDSTSERPANSKGFVGSSEDGDVDLLLSFGNLGLGEDGFTSSSRANTCQCNNGLASSSCLSCSSAEARKEEVTGDTQFKRRLDKSPMVPTFEDEQRQSIPQEDISAYQTFINGEDPLLLNLHSGQESSVGSMPYTNQYDLNYESNNLAGKVASRSSCYGGPVMPNSVNQFEGKSVLSNPASVYLGMGDSRLNYNSELYYMSQSLCTNHDEFEATGSNGYLPNSMASSTGLWNHQGAYCGDLNTQIFLKSHYLPRQAMSENGSQWLQRLLQNGNPGITNIVLQGVFESLVELMTDQYGSYVFQRLIEQCDYSQLELVVQRITLQRGPSLVDAAFTRHGSYSIQKLIKLLKKLDLAKLVTSALSTGMFELMTDNTGRHVISRCLNLLDSRQNKVLYEAAIKHCVELAMDPVGCISLNTFIDCIKGPLRHPLLDRISEESVCLSLDPSGNYVVQHVLGLENSLFSDKICYCLRGNYVRLSQIKHGSHVVEKCLRASGWGIYYLAEEIRKDRGMLEKVARDQFGNYVIQTALKISKKEPFSSIHDFLVKTLQPHLSCLEKTKASMNVVRLIRDEASSKSKF